MSRRPAKFCVPILLLAMLPLAACSISKSVESSAKLISSPLTSSSASSSPEESYREDVRDYTATHVQSGGSADALRRGLANVADKHGISDWERSQSTYRGVGEGLAKAGYRQVQVDAFKTNFADTPEQAEWIQRGYDSAR